MPLSREPIMRRLALSFFVLAACSKDDPETAVAAEGYALSLDTPAPAAWLPAGELVASGHAVGLADLTVAGVPAQRSGDAFSAAITLERGVSLVEVRGDIEDSHHAYLRHGVLAGDFANAEAAVARAAALRLNRGGIEVALSEVGALLDPAVLEPALTAINPVYEDAYGVLGLDAVEVRADVASVAFDPPELAATPAAGVLTLEVALPALEVWVPVSGAVVGIDFTTDVWIGAERAEVSGLVTLDAVDGALEVGLVDPSVELVGFWYDTSLLPGDVESWILVDTVRGALEAALVAQIEALVPALLEQQLSALDLSFTAELLGRQVTVTAIVADAWIDQSGVALVANLDVDVPGSVDHPHQGYLTAGFADPRPDTTSDVTVALADDLLNRLLFEAWRAGLLQLELSTADGSLEPALLSQLGARQEATVLVDAALPPVVVARDGALQAQIAELGVTILTPDGEYGERLDLSVALFVGLELAVSGGELTLDLLDPEVVLTVRDSDWGARDEVVANALADQLPLDALLLLLGDLSFPLPALGNVAIGSAAVARDDTGVYTGIRVELE